MRWFPISMLLIILLAGCASISHGTTQQIAVTTEPPGATCTLSRQGLSIATIAETPGVALVQRDKRDILATCSKPGYQIATRTLHSGVADSSFGNILAGGLIGVAIDSANGADNEYPASVSIPLTPDQSDTAAAN
jgi:hypothetical protein